LAGNKHRFPDEGVPHGDEDNSRQCSDCFDLSIKRDVFLSYHISTSMTMNPLPPPPLHTSITTTSTITTSTRVQKGINFQNDFS
jgi:hypothetical protein